MPILLRREQQILATEWEQLNALFSPLSDSHLSTEKSLAFLTVPLEKRVLKQFDSLLRAY